MEESKLLNARRFLHWGPISTLAIIKCITLTTLYMNSMWWPPNDSFSGFCNQALLLIMSSTALFNYVLATISGPGYLPKHWHPKNPKDAGQLQYCKICDGFKAPRSHHCRKCNRCVKKMDHHCPWINNCVGWNNHSYFTYFLFFSIIGSFQAAIILSCSFYRGIYRYYYLSHGFLHLARVRFTMITVILCIFAMGLAIGVVIALNMLLYFQLKSIIYNQTGIEMWIVEKAIFRRYHNPSLREYIYPYDLGWKENMKQVFSKKCRKQGDGIEYAVLKSCDQYSFTREQLAQKAEKRARTKTFKCIRAASGRYLPISQGFRVCLSPPCTDEPRIRLQPDDIVKVTRIRNHWLFGERVLSDEELKNPKKKRKGALRGWFPRRCAIELIEPQPNPCPDSDEDQNLEYKYNFKVSSIKKTPNSNKQSNHDKKSTNGFKTPGNSLTDLTYKPRIGNWKKSN